MNVYVTSPHWRDGMRVYYALKELPRAAQGIRVNQTDWGVEPKLLPGDRLIVVAAHRGDTPEWEVLPECVLVSPHPDKPEWLSLVAAMGISADAECIERSMTELLIHKEEGP